MRCKKAKEDYLSNRDGMLTEPEKIRLQQHLEICAGCTGFAREMDECLGVLGDLPDMEVSDNFEWNLKMKIAREKSRMMRDHGTPLFGGNQWGMKFVASMAATMIIVLAGAFFVLRSNGVFPDRNTPQVPAARQVAERDVSAIPSERPRVNVNYTESGYPAGIRMVSDDFLGAGPADSYSRQSPFSMESERQVECLVKENEALKKYLEHYKAENAYLKKLLLQRSTKR